MTHVLVVGAGIAGVPAAYMMKNRLGAEDKVTVVSNKNYFHFVPSNPWVAMGWRDRSDIAFPIGPCLAEHGIDFIPQEVMVVDGAHNQVELADGRKMSYDYLILATGPEPAFEEIPGLDPSAGFVHSVVHLEDATQTHVAYRQFVKNPGPVVIGAAPGSSILGPIYEFAFLVDADLRRRNIRDQAPITLITPEPYVGHLGIGQESHARHLLEQALAECNITCLTNAKTRKIERGLVHIVECDMQGNELRSGDVQFAYAVFWAAFRGVSALRNSPGLTDKRGFVKTDEFLRSTTFPNVFAVGVCGVHPAVSKTPLNIGAPASVYSIQNEVDAGVRNIAATMTGQALISPAPRRAIWLSDMGKTGAAYHSEPQIPLRNINWLKEGRWVHLAKVDFENYFINKIRLKPAGDDALADSHVATMVRKLQSRKAEGVPPAAAPHAVSRHVSVPVPKDLDYDLRALSLILGQDERTLASTLLESAFHDACTFLEGATLDDMQKARHDLMVADVPESQPGVEFHGGGT